MMAFTAGRPHGVGVQPQVPPPAHGHAAGPALPVRGLLVVAHGLAARREGQYRPGACVPRSLTGSVPAMAVVACIHRVVNGRADRLSQSRVLKMAVQNNHIEHSLTHLMPVLGSRPWSAWAAAGTPATWMCSPSTTSSSAHTPGMWLPALQPYMRLAACQPWCVAVPAVVLTAPGGAAARLTPFTPCPENSACAGSQHGRIASWLVWSSARRFLFHDSGT